MLFVLFAYVSHYGRGGLEPSFGVFSHTYSMGPWVLNTNDELHAYRVRKKIIPGADYYPLKVMVTQKNGRMAQSASPNEARIDTP
jgi:hypothetical protein